MKQFIVYGLADPREPDTIRYVGATSRSLKQRLRDHCSGAVKAQHPNRVQVWIRMLLGMKLSPVVHELVECDESEVRAVEGKWIGYFRRKSDTVGFQLNHQIPPAAWDKGDFYLSDKLKKWRAERPQKQAADKLGVSLSTYRNWEHGVNVPGALAMKEIERVLETQW